MRADRRRRLVAGLVAAVLGSPGCGSSRDEPGAPVGPERKGARSAPQPAAAGTPDAPGAPVLPAQENTPVGPAPEPSEPVPRPRRLDLVVASTPIRGWKAAETEHYLFVFADGVDPSLLRTLKERAEELRTAVLEPRFPAEDAEEGILVVRVCEDRDQYHAYGGAAGSAGTFDPHGAELVVYQDASSKRSTVESLQSLVCTAYLHEALGARAGHAWFHHGLAAWAGAHTSRDGRLAVHEPSRQRRRAGELKRAGSAPRLDALLTWVESVRAPDPSLSGVASTDLRALAVDLVDFLLSSPDAEVSQIPARYFAALARGVTKEVARAEATADVDLLALERSWLAF